MLTHSTTTFFPQDEQPALPTRKNTFIELQQGPAALFEPLKPPPQISTAAALGNSQNGRILQERAGAVQGDGVLSSQDAAPLQCNFGALFLCANDGMDDRLTACQGLLWLMLDDCKRMQPGLGGLNINPVPKRALLNMLQDDLVRQVLDECREHERIFQNLTRQAASIARRP